MRSTERVQPDAQDTTANDTAASSASLTVARQPVTATSGEAAVFDPGRRFLTVGSARRLGEGSAGYSRHRTKRRPAISHISGATLTHSIIATVAPDATVQERQRDIRICREARVRNDRPSARPHQRHGRLIPVISHRSPEARGRGQQSHGVRGPPSQSARAERRLEAHVTLSKLARLAGQRQIRG
jgi:hypothetical protein